MRRVGFADRANRPSKASPIIRLNHRTKSRDRVGACSRMMTAYPAHYFEVCLFRLLSVPWRQTKRAQPPRHVRSA